MAGCGSEPSGILPGSPGVFEPFPGSLPGLPVNHASLGARGKGFRVFHVLGVPSEIDVGNLRRAEPLEIERRVITQIVDLGDPVISKTPAAFETRVSSLSIKRYEAGFGDDAIIFLCDLERGGLETEMIGDCAKNLRQALAIRDDPVSLERRIDVDPAAGL